MAMSIHWLTLLGIFLIAIGTFFTLWDQQKISKEHSKLLEAKSDKIRARIHMVMHPQILIDCLYLSRCDFANRLSYSLGDN